MTLIISEEIREWLGLGVADKKFVRVANGQRVECMVTEPVEIFWENRSSVEKVIVMPGLPEVLLGVTPLEVMDLMVDPVSQELVRAHDDDWAEWVF